MASGKFFRFLVEVGGTPLLDLEIGGAGDSEHRVIGTGANGNKKRAAKISQAI